MFLKGGNLPKTRRVMIDSNSFLGSLIQSGRQEEQKDEAKASFHD